MKLIEKFAELCKQYKCVITNYKILRHWAESGSTDSQISGVASVGFYPKPNMKLLEKILTECISENMIGCVSEHDKISKTVKLLESLYNQYSNNIHMMLYIVKKMRSSYHNGM